MPIRFSVRRSTLAILSLAVCFVTYATPSTARAAEDLPASAEEIDPKRSGDRAPAFTVRTVDGDAYRFDPQNLDRPTILITFRGGWCPYCNLHLSELRHVIPEINEMGVDVLFLSGDSPGQLYSGLAADTQADIDGRDYVILSDADIDAARALGIAFRVDPRLGDYLDNKGRDYAGSSIGRHGALPVPAVYVVDTDGRIVFDYVNADYKVRLPQEELLAAARAAAP